MKFQTFFLFAALVSLQAVVPGSIYGQSQQATANQQPASLSTPASQAQAAPIPNAKPAKVWTNDDVDTLHNNPGVSVIGKPTTQNASSTLKVYSQQKDPAWYRKQIESLRADIDKLEPQIAKLQAFLSGEIINDPNTMHRKMVPTPQDQLKQLQAKRQADEAKIEDLLDRARHNGILPGALR
jgi:cell division protein FtsB